SEADTGVYRVASQFGLLLNFVLQAVETGMSPQFAALQARGELFRVAGAARRMIGVLMIVGGVPGVLVLVFAKEVMSIFGPEFVTGTTALRTLIAGQLVLFVLGPVGSVLIMTGLGRLSFWNSMGGTASVVVLSALLIPPFGVEGAAIAASVTTVVRAVVASAIVWQRRGLFLPLGLTRRPEVSSA